MPRTVESLDRGAEDHGPDARPEDCRHAHGAGLRRRFGIYRVVEKGEGKLVDRSIGGQVNLGTRRSQDFGDVSIWSISNQNDMFRVWMKQSGLVVNRGRFAIYVDDVCEVIGSQGQSEGSDKTDLIADVKGEENIRKIAAALKTEVIEREHPGY